MFSVTFHHQILISGSGFSESGDSGSLIVTVDSARPLGLLFAGSATTTAAHPITDVLGALRDAVTGEAPRIVGEADHPVSCAAMATISGQVPPPVTEGAPSPEELARVNAARERFAKDLLLDPAVAGLGVGTSADRPTEGALLVYLRGHPSGALPAAVGGVRTRFLWPEGTKEGTELGSIGRALRTKDARSIELLRRPGVIAVGVGLSKDAPGEPAIVLFVERGATFAGVEPVLDGVRTQVLEEERFRAFGWGRPGRSGSGGCCGQR